MSKENWVAAGAAVVLVLLIALYGTHNPFETPANAPENIIPLGGFDGSGSFADSLMAPSNLIASPSGATQATGTKTETPAKQEPGIPPGLALALGSLRDALVNVICVSRDGSTRSISGSGVMVSPEGLILTNAHVAQLFLLKDYPKKNNVVCVIRTGNPAQTAYIAQLAYISGPWIQNNAQVLVSKDPKGSGENDFAVLAITESATNDRLPSRFPFVPLSDEIPTDQEPVAIGSYGAQTLTSKQIKSSLYPTLVFGKVLDRFTFTKTTVDVLSLGGSAVAQEGSSGGGVVNAKGELIAIISTSSIDGNLSSRDLHAITVGHIRRSFESDTGADFDVYLASTATDTLIANFVDQAKKLSSIITSAISSSH